MSLASCRARKTESVSELTRKETTITERLVPVKIKGDTSGSAKQLRVKDGKIVIDREIYTDRSDRAGAPIVNIDTAGILEVKCPCLEQETEVKVSDTETTTEKIVEKTVEVPVNYVTDWQVFQIWLGRILLAGIILWGLIFILRKRSIFFR